MFKIDDFSAASGRMIKEDGTTVNIADVLAPNAEPVSQSKYDINSFSARSGRLIREDGSIINIANLLKEWIDSGGSGGGGGSYTLPQATESILGGIKAKQRTTETAEAAIDPETGKMYVPEQAGSLVVKDHIISLMGGTENAET